MKTEDIPTRVKDQIGKFEVDSGVVICSTFGCRRELSATEQLCGTVCIKCTGKKDKVFKHYNL